MLADGSDADGSDAVHKDPDYSAVYVRLQTDATARDGRPVCAASAALPA